MGEKSTFMARNNSCIRQPFINTCTSSTRLSATSPSQDMHSCSALIGRLKCPCNRFWGGADATICDDCIHLLSCHVSSTTPEPALEHSEPSPQATGPTPLQSRSVTSLFQSLLKSTTSGSLAIQETSTGFHSSGSNIIAVGFLGI